MNAIVPITTKVIPGKKKKITEDCPTSKTLKKSVDMITTGGEELNLFHYDIYIDLYNRELKRSSQSFFFESGPH